MTRIAHRLLRLAAAGTVVAVALISNGEMLPHGRTGVMSTAEARVGRPVTPVSYAGVARRSTVGVGYGGVGGPASGVGVLPGAGAGQVGVGYSGGVGVNSRRTGQPRRCALAREGAAYPRTLEACECFGRRGDCESREPQAYGWPSCSRAVRSGSAEILISPEYGWSICRIR